MNLQAYLTTSRQVETSLDVHRITDRFRRVFDVEGAGFTSMAPWQLPLLVLSDCHRVCHVPLDGRVFNSCCSWNCVYLLPALRASYDDTKYTINVSAVAYNVAEDFPSSTFPTPPEACAQACGRRARCYGVGFQAHQLN